MLGAKLPDGPGAAAGRLLGAAHRPGTRWPRPSGTSWNRLSRLAAARRPGQIPAGVQSRVAGSAPSKISSQRLTSMPVPPL